ncbi:helix-turn-helix domain-containing protein [Streptomyces sp. NPDC005046]
MSLASCRTAGGISGYFSRRKPAETTSRPSHSRGLAAARARGERIGRPPAMSEEQIRHARGLLTDPENTITSIAKLLGVFRTTLYKYVPELTAGRDALVSGPVLPGPR